MFKKKKSKNNILVNYEGTPFYNIDTNEWLIDFSENVKNELFEMINADDSYVKLACILAQPNVSIRILKAFRKPGCLDNIHAYHECASHCHKDIKDSRPYVAEDIHFLFYRLSQLLTKHEDIPSEEGHSYIMSAATFLEYKGIDIIDELGDIFYYDYITIEDFEEEFWKTQINIFFVDKTFKSPKIVDAIHKSAKIVYILDTILL